MTEENAIIKKAGDTTGSVLAFNNLVDLPAE